MIFNRRHLTIITSESMIENSIIKHAIGAYFLATLFREDRMLTLAHIIMWFMLAWLAALAVAVLFRSISKGQLYELLYTTTPGNGTGDAIDPERAQLVVVSLGAIGLYFVDGIQAATTGPITILPEASEALTAALAGSNTLYLSGKLLRHHRPEPARRS
jgi:hypothetical protein